MACLTEEGKVAESRNPSCPEPSSLCFWVPSPDIPIHVLMNLEHCLIGIQTLCEAENVKVIHTPDSIWHQSKLECDSPSLSYLPIVLWLRWPLLLSVWDYGPERWRKYRSKAAITSFVVLGYSPSTITVHTGSHWQWNTAVQFWPRYLRHFRYVQGKPTFVWNLGDSIKLSAVTRGGAGQHPKDVTLRLTPGSPISYFRQSYLATSPLIAQST